jgi:glutaminyl-tRNA synthetase
MPEELFTHVTNYITSHAITGWANLSSVLSGVKGTPELQWASPLELKNTVSKVFMEKFRAKKAAKPKVKVCLFAIRIILDKLSSKIKGSPPL